MGVNTIGLLDIDPQRIIVPILHCPIGLVDKVLQVFKAWTTCEAERLPEESENTRLACKNAAAMHQLSVSTALAAKQLAEQTGTVG